MSIRNMLAGVVLIGTTLSLSASEIKVWPDQVGGTPQPGREGTHPHMGQQNNQHWPSPTAPGIKVEIPIGAINGGARQHGGFIGAGPMGRPSYRDQYGPI